MSQPTSFEQFFGNETPESTPASSPAVDRNVDRETPAVETPAFVDRNIDRNEDTVVDRNEAVIRHVLLEGEAPLPSALDDRSSETPPAEDIDSTAVSPDVAEKALKDRSSSAAAEALFQLRDVGDNAEVPDVQLHDDVEEIAEVPNRLHVSESDVDRLLFISDDERMVIEEKIKNHDEDLKSWGKPKVKLDKNKERDPNGGWIQRNLSDYFVSRDEMTNSWEDVARVTSAVYNELNQIKFPRILSEASRCPFAKLQLKQKGFLKNFRKLFYDDETSLFGSGVKVDFVDKLVYPTVIKFEERVVNDKRIQFEFLRDSIIHKRVKAALSKAGIIDENSEDIEDVSLLIGGTETQHIHTDISRMYCFWQNDVNGMVTLAHEVDRKVYNDAVSCRNGMSSIIIDLSSDAKGFLLSIPKLFVEVTDKQHCKLLFSDEVYEIVKEEENTYTILIENGCQFSADFCHAGSDNVSKKLNSEETKQFHDWTQTILDTIQKQTGTLTKLFAKVNDHNFDLSKVTRFFCKTYPKNTKVLVMKENVDFPVPADYSDLIEGLQKNAEIRDKKRGKKNKQPDASPARRATRSKTTDTTPPRSTPQNEEAKKIEKIKKPTKPNAAAKPKATRKAKAPTKSTKKVTKKKVDSVTKDKVAKTTPSGKKKVKETVIESSPSDKKKLKESRSTSLSLAFKNTESRLHARCHEFNLPEIQQKSIQRRHQRSAQEFKNVVNRIVENSMIEYCEDVIASQPLITQTYPRTKAKPNAFASYFHLEDFERQCEEAKDDFLILLKRLWKQMMMEIRVDQRGWLYGVNYQGQGKTKMCKSYEWILSLKFRDWWLKASSDEEIPVVEWFHVIPKIDGTLGVYARRDFEKDEIISLFFGFDNEDKETVSKFAIVTPYGVFDPQRGFSSGGNPQYYFGMHVAEVTDDAEKANALLLQTLLVKATKSIKNGEEIILRFDNGVSRVVSPDLED